MQSNQSLAAATPTTAVTITTLSTNEVVSMDQAMVDCNADTTTASADEEEVRVLPSDSRPINAVTAATATEASTHDKCYRCSCKHSTAPGIDEKESSTVAAATTTTTSSQEEEVTGEPVTTGQRASVAQHQQQQQQQQRTSLGSETCSRSRSWSKHSGGHDFYDEGYDDDDEPLKNRIIFDSSKFFGRNEELQTLKDAYYSQLLGCRYTNRNKRSRSNNCGRCGSIIGNDCGTSCISNNTRKKKEKKRWSSGNTNIGNIQSSTGSLIRDETNDANELGLNESRVGSEEKPLTPSSGVAVVAPHQSTSSSSSSSSGPPAVIIEGFSGNGKSALVRRFVEEVSKLHCSEDDYDCDDNHIRDAFDCNVGECPLPLFITGKYQELHSGDQPFSAILDALSSFFDYLYEEERNKTRTVDEIVQHQLSRTTSPRRNRSLQRHSLARIRTAIMDVLGDQVDLLTVVIPALERVVDEKYHEEKTESRPAPGTPSTSSSKNQINATVADGSVIWNQLRYIFLKLFGAISSEGSPLILFLDDLQWIDEASVELLQSLLEDPSLQHVMFIGALRAEQKNKNVKLSAMLDKLQSAPGGYRSVTRIELLNLSIDELGQFVAHTTCLSEIETRPLTEIIYGKTRGNIFFSMQLIEELHRRNILYYSLISFQWEWNLNDLEFESNLSENVIAAVALKIQTLPEKLQRALVIAAYTRSSIDVHTLLQLVRADGFDIDEKELVGLLDIAVLEGLLLNTVGSDTYCFAHDRIQQASYWMVPSGKERDELRVLIGKKLVDLYSESSNKQDWKIFVAAGHLNSCTNHGQDILALVQLNLVCGERAFKLAAFVPASLYLRLALKGIHKLNESPWETHYDLCLRVYRGITNIELCLGNASGFDLGKEVLSRGRCFDDKIPTYLALVRATGQKRNHAEAFALCQEALFHLKAIPKRFRIIHLINDVGILRRLFRTHSDQEILALPICSDEAKSIIMELLTEYAIRSIHCGHLDQYLFGLLRALRMTFENGLSGGSAYAMAGYGIFLQKTGAKADGPLRMAQLARKILDRTNPSSRPIKAVTLLVISYFIEAWSQPRENIMESYQQAHRCGMATGNMEMAFQNWTLCNLTAQTTGYPLKPVEEAGAEILSLAKRYNVASTIPHVEALRVLVLCLNGQRPVDWDELEPPEMSSTHIKSGNVFGCLFTLLSRLETGVYFENPEFAVRMFEKLHPFLKVDGSFIGLSKGYFFAALAYVAASRKLCMSRYVTKARRLGRKLRNLCRTHGLNPLHKSLLVDAELLSTRIVNSARLMVSYDSAIYAAIKIGYMQDAALGMELCGKALLNLGEELRGLQYLTQARDMWREYGALGKVDHLALVYGRKMDRLTLDTLETIGEHPLTSGDFGASRTSLDLELLAGASIRTNIQMKFPPDEAEETKDRQDEVSILTDPSASGLLPPASGPITRACTH